MKKLRLRSKIILSTLSCVLIVSLLGNILVFLYMREIISDQRDEINHLYLDNISDSVNLKLSDSVRLVLQCANDSVISKGVSNTDPTSYRPQLSAQKQMNNYLSVFNENKYVDKLIAFNLEGTFIQATRQNTFGHAKEPRQLIDSSIVQEMINSPQTVPYLIKLGSSLIPYSTSARSIIIICPIAHFPSVHCPSFVYLELNLKMFQDALEPFSKTNNLFLSDDAGNFLTPLPDILQEDFTIEHLLDGIYESNNQTYLFLQEPLSYGNFSINLCYSTDLPGTGTNDLLFPAVIVFFMFLILTLMLAFITSYYIVRPIDLLKNRLRLISDKNDFSFDPAIEASGDELGAMGEIINEMSLSIKHLLENNEKMYEKKRNIELSLLQSQVNPHFLYNTLDSIRWMAIIQKNTGIAQMSQRLVNLLRNLAKGTQDKIPLRDELSLLEDYIEIQNVRYVETFSFQNKVPEELMDYRILKFTLQPLAENALFHGIEPTGRFGTITLSGRLEGNDLLLTVEDNGMGIPPEKLKTLLNPEKKASYDEKDPSAQGQSTHHSNALNGIGIANVHQRLRLLYGPEYGLTIESELGSFTRVTIRIPAEH